MFFKLSALSFALLAFLCGCTNAEVAKKKYLESGNKYFAEKKYQEALLEYNNALKADDKFGEARFQLAEPLAEAGEPEAAYRQYIRAADLMPDNEKVQIKAATVLLLAQQFQDVQSRMQQLLKAHPKNVDAQVLLANAMAGLGDFDRAVSQVEDAIQIDPQSAPAYTNLGLLRVAQGQREAARVAFEKAVEPIPNQSRPVSRSAIFSGPAARFRWPRRPCERGSSSIPKTRWPIARWRPSMSVPTGRRRPRRP